MTLYRPLTRGWPENHPNHPRVAATRIQQRNRIRGMMKAGDWETLEKEFRFKARFIPTESGRGETLDWSCIPVGMYHILQVGGRNSTVKTRKFLKTGPSNLHANNGRPRTKSLRLRCPERLPVRERLWIEQNGHCYFCAQTVRREDWTLEHLLPLVLGGTNAAENLKGTCSACNNAKGAMTEEEFLESSYFRRLKAFYANGGEKYPQL